METKAKQTWRLFQQNGSQSAWPLSCFAPVHYTRFHVLNIFIGREHSRTFSISVCLNFAPIRFACKRIGTMASEGSGRVLSENRMYVLDALLNLNNFVVSNKLRLNEFKFNQWTIWIFLSFHPHTHIPAASLSLRRLPSAFVPLVPFHYGISQTTSSFTKCSNFVSISSVPVSMHGFNRKLLHSLDDSSLSLWPSSSFGSSFGR